MVEAFVGQVGGGKSFSSVRRMCNYIASGGIVVSNIKLTGYSDELHDLSSDSPVRVFLRDRFKWEYQSGQYQYISFDEMATLPGWFKRVPGGPDRLHRTFLCIDEATDLFDTLDRGKLANDSVYRELFRFLRLSRHVHVDVLFICQDLNSINSRLRGLVSFIWKSTDLSNFRLPGLRVALPVNSFLLQQFDRTGKLELRREFVAKDRRIFSLYESEAFHDSMGFTFASPVQNGKITRGRKMSVIQKCFLFLALFLSGYSLYTTLSLRSDVFTLQALVKDSFSNFGSEKPVFFNSNDNTDKSLLPTRKIIRAYIEFVGTNKGDYCFVDGNKYRPGMLTEYGICKVVSRDMVVCVDGLQETVILPCSRALEASAGSL